MRHLGVGNIWNDKNEARSLLQYKGHKWSQNYFLKKGIDEKRAEISRRYPYKSLLFNNRGNNHIQRVFSSQIHLVPIGIFAQNPNITFFVSGKQRTPMACKHLLYLKEKINWHSTLAVANTFLYKFSQHDGSINPLFASSALQHPSVRQMSQVFDPLICIFHSSHF